MATEAPIRFELKSPYGSGIVTWLEETRNEFPQTLSLWRRAAAVARVCRGCPLTDDCRPQMTAVGLIIEEVNIALNILKTGTHVIVAGGHVQDQYQCKLRQGISWSQIPEDILQNREKYGNFDNLIEREVVPVRNIRK